MSQYYNIFYYFYKLILFIIMSKAKKEYKRITVKSLLDMKIEGEKISMLTAYDFTTAAIVDGSGIDIILVGENL